MGQVSEPVFHVVLLEPEIPPNTGTIGRLCLGTGCRLHLVEPLGFRIDQKTVRRAGLDYWKNVDLRVHADFEALLEALPGRMMTFTSAREGVSFTRHVFQPGEVLVFGRESVGLPEAFSQRFKGQFIRIPLRGSIRSLNLAQAVAVVLFEGLKQVQPELF